MKEQFTWQKIIEQGIDKGNYKKVQKNFYTLLF